MCIISIRLFLVKISSPVSYPQTKRIEGHCKYGDRCTFAHGEHDMRAKFVKAELLYPSATQQTNSDVAQPQTSAFGTVDYSAFTAPPGTTIAEASFGNSEIPQEPEQKEASDFGSDFNIPPFDPNQFTEDNDNNGFLNSFNYKNENGGSNQAPVASNTTKASPQMAGEAKNVGQVSKFGFGYEALSENLDELEVTSNSKEVIEKFSQAKYQIEMGNIEDGNQILNDMMTNGEIKYKEFSSIDQHIMSSTFGPISE